MAGSIRHSRVRHTQTVFRPFHVLQEPGAIEQQHADDAGTAVEAGGIIDQMVQLSATQAERITRNGWARFAANWLASS